MYKSSDSTGDLSQAEENHGYLGEFDLEADMARDVNSDELLEH
jgi:hypothetical protein